MAKVFVSGCYDMLHSGHVAFFEEAATHGDLYVGIGSDKTIFGLKNRRTINTEQERLYMVKALRTAAKACVPSKARAAAFIFSTSRRCGKKQARFSRKGSRRLLLCIL